MRYSGGLLPCSKLERSSLRRKINIIDTEGTKGRGLWEIKTEQDALSAGLLIKGIVAGTLPETGVAGTMCS